MGWSKRHIDETRIQLLFAEVTINFHMFRPNMLNWIMGNVDDRFVVTIEHHRKCNADKKTQKKTLELNKLTNAMGHNSMEFHFGTRPSYNSLLLASPSDKAMKVP